MIENNDIQVMIVSNVFYINKEYKLVMIRYITHLINKNKA